MSAYCTESDLYDYGMPRGAVPNQGRLVDSVDTTADTLELNMHGFADDEAVRFRADGMGSLPTPLVEGTTYYAIRSNESRFQVAASAGGAAIDLTTEGERIVVFAELPVDASITWASAIIDDMLPAHVVPLDEGALPEIIRTTAAELAAWKLSSRSGSASMSLTEIMKEARARLNRWAKHVPIRGTNAPTSAGLSVSSSGRSPSDWDKYGGI